MNEKIILENPNGEKEEKILVCHFKSISDARPNIKNIPILVCDKNELNNGNKVLEFLWEKDGLYQEINDANAWTEVKQVIINLIKDTLTEGEIEGIQVPEVKRTLSNATQLAVNPTQVDALKVNANKWISTVKEETPVQENIENNNVVPPVSTPTLETPTETPQEKTEETVNIPQNVENNNVETPPVNTSVTPSEIPQENGVGESQNVIENPAPVMDTPSEIPTIPNQVPVDSTTGGTSPVIDSNPVENNEVVTPSESPVMPIPTPTVEPSVMQETVAVTPTVTESTPVMDATAPVTETPVENNIETNNENNSKNISEIVNINSVNEMIENAKQTISDLTEKYKQEVSDVVNNVLKQMEECGKNLNATYDIINSRKEISESLTPKEEIPQGTPSVLEPQAEPPINNTLESAPTLEVPPVTNVEPIPTATPIYGDDISRSLGKAA